MNLFELSFILFILKWSAGKGLLSYMNSNHDKKILPNHHLIAKSLTLISKK